MIEVEPCESAVLVRWTDPHDGLVVCLPLIKRNGVWSDTGAYTKSGMSRSDPNFGTVYGLRWGWKITRRIREALERSGVA